MISDERSLFPADLGFRFPAEWSPHAGTWLTWPHNQNTWPHNLSEAQSEFETFVRTIADVEPVNLLATGELGKSLTLQFSSHPQISVFDIVTNDSWIRDYGPTYVKAETGSIWGIDWIYNGWGEKYPPFDSDQEAAKRILASSSIPSFQSSLVLEGGSIESNGESACLTTRQSVQARNPKRSTPEIKKELHQTLGLEDIYVLECAAIQGDDTDGHVDQVARFISPHQIVVSQRQAALVKAQLKKTDFQVIELPDPAEVKMFGTSLPCSYTNFYFANSTVIVPQFGDPQDDWVVGLLRELLPSRVVQGLPSRNLSVGLGSFHCLAQQQPA
ncbi:MAG: agmatine deiminase family protein [Planctomycetota bacterium]|nr:agmatine deiminase family protein [Planctomycetota bacterium]